MHHGSKTIIVEKFGGADDDKPLTDIESKVVKDVPKELKRFAGGFEEGRRCKARPTKNRPLRNRWSVPGGLVKRVSNAPGAQKLRRFINISGWS